MIGPWKILYYLIYERELAFMRESGAEFARKYPKIAGRLLLEQDRCEDPHTERLLEGFAFLSARIQKKLDDAFPELTESLLQIIYPHYTRPVPSMTTIKFNPLLANIPSSGHRIRKGTKMFTPPVKNIPLTFTTTQEVCLWPIDVVDAGIAYPSRPGEGAVSGIKLTFKLGPKLDLARLEGPDTLRFFINAHQQHAFKLYELIMNNAVGIECATFSNTREGKIQRDSFSLSNEHIEPVGFQEKDGLLPWPEPSFDGFRLLFEYFAFPEKFLFFDIRGLQRLARCQGDCFEIKIYLNSESAEGMLINQDTFCLYATPAINLFPQTALPIRVEHRKNDYPVYHDTHTKQTTEVFSIEKVIGTSDHQDRQKEYHPFYSVSHFEQYGEQGAYWHLQRRSSPRKDDEGLDVLLSFTDAGLGAIQPEADTLLVQTICSNRDLPARLVFGGTEKDFRLETACPIDRISCLMKPTPVRRSFHGRRMQWRLISHLSLNYQSLLEKNGRGLKELLKLYDIHDSPVTRQQIEGLEAIESHRSTMRVEALVLSGHGSRPAF